MLERAKRTDQIGFTLMEIMIVIAIIAVLIVLGMANWKLQIGKAYDVQRKSDLKKIQKAFEEYFSDHQCYPDVTVMTNANCKGPILKPYLQQLPCDPLLNETYAYIPVDPTDMCKGYKLLARLINTDDADITALGCHPVNGCGYGTGYNYGVTSGVKLVADGFVSGLAPTPTPGPQPGQYACSAGGYCNSWGGGGSCPTTFADPNCYGLCGIAENRCSN